MVLVVLAILATMIVPRFASNEQRLFNAAVDQTADLLTMYAQRESLGQKVVGLHHNRADNWLELYVIDTADGDAGPGDWRTDKFVSPVKLPLFMSDADVDIFADGQRIDAGEWPLSTEVGQDRPQIEVRLRREGQAASIILSPHGVAPIVINDINSSGVTRMRYDLDAAGRNREDW